MSFVTSDEAAKKYRFNRRYIAEMCRKGRFGTAIQVRSRFNKLQWIVAEEEIEQYLDQTNRGPYRPKVYRVIREIFF